MQISKDRLKLEIAEYSSLSTAEKQAYKEEVQQLEGNIYEFINGFLEEESAAIFEEQIRDMVYVSVITAGGKDIINATTCAKKITYTTFNTAIEFATNNTSVDFKNGIVSTYHANQEQRDNAIKSSDFIKYVRGYGKYWRSKIDENLCEENYSIPKNIRDQIDESIL